MYTQAVLDHFGSATATAKALGITKSAVSQWPKLVPLGRAYQIQAVTAGALSVDAASYTRASKRKRHK
jgi:DNA-binding transcriptional regulator YdaS (Cro superfamily)